MPYTDLNQPRKPEPAEVYDLGFYEQMQINLLFAAWLDEGGAGLANEISLDTLQSLRHLFDGPGTVTVIRKGVPL